ncbi:hypothetical protein DLM76_01970 [Leptospira yasudae]|nr:hypothetical protein DLM76_01970 [Leptospira yasudae]
MSSYICGYNKHSLTRKRIRASCTTRMSSHNLKFHDCSDKRSGKSLHQTVFVHSRIHEQILNHRNRTQTNR